MTISYSAIAKITTEIVAVQRHNAQIACTTKICIATSAIPAAASPADQRP